MEWFWWLAIALAAAMFIVDWIIVLGTNPKKWKGRKDK